MNPSDKVAEIRDICNNLYWSLAGDIRQLNTGLYGVFHNGIQEIVGELNQLQVELESRE
jgi:hypothetical protein